MKRDLVVFLRLCAKFALCYVIWDGPILTWVHHRNVRSNYSDHLESLARLFLFWFFGDISSMNVS